MFVTFGSRVPTRQIREFSIFSLNNALIHSQSAMCDIGANDICIYFDIFSKDNVSFDDTLGMTKCLDWVYVFSSVMF
jgi:hypothetical protein